jgi:hypothetical protein
LTSSTAWRGQPSGNSCCSHPDGSVGRGRIWPRVSALAKPRRQPGVGRPQPPRRTSARLHPRAATFGVRRLVAAFILHCPHMPRSADRRRAADARRNSRCRNQSGDKSPHSTEVTARDRVVQSSRRCRTPRFRNGTNSAYAAVVAGVVRRTNGCPGRLSR